MNVFVLGAHSRYVLHIFHVVCSCAYEKSWKCRLQLLIYYGCQKKILSGMVLHSIHISSHLWVILVVCC